MTHRIVVLGAGYAGLAAAKRAARRLRRTDVRVTLVNLEDRFVERVRLHQLATGQRLRDLPLRKLLHGTGVELVVAAVTGIDTGTRTVRLDAPPHTLDYDTLVYALGSRADTDTVPGVAEHALALATAQDAVRLRDRLSSTPANGPLAVVGGGLTGIETAAELAEAHPGRSVQLLTGAELGPSLSRRGRRYLHRGFDRRGVTVRENAPVARVQAGGLVLADGQEVAADTVVWAAGFRVPPLARDAGFAVDAHGRMAVDDKLRSLSHSEVYAVGDAAAAQGPGAKDSRMSCQTALPMGLQAADGIVALLTGRDPRPLRLRYVGQNISLGRSDGLIQFARPDDSPVESVLTGRTAARLKEAVIRGTVQVMRRPGPYTPARPGRPSGSTEAV